jgi:uncharacterized protein (UPF0261 family)
MPLEQLGEMYPNIVNFGPRDAIPERFEGHLFYQHNPTVTLMRTTPKENARIGEEIRRKVAASTGPAAIMLPLQGVSAIDVVWQAFDDPAASQALFAGIRQSHGAAELVGLDHLIDDAEFAEATANRLLRLMRPSGLGMWLASGLTASIADPS